MYSEVCLFKKTRASNTPTKDLIPSDQGWDKFW